MLAATVGNVISRFSRIGLLAKTAVEGQYQIQSTLWTLTTEEINDKVRALNASNKGKGKPRGARTRHGTDDSARTKNAQDDLIEVDALEILEQLHPEGLVALIGEMVSQLRAEKAAMVERVNAQITMLGRTQDENDKLRRELVIVQGRLATQQEDLARLRANRGGGLIERTITVRGPQIVPYDVGADNAASGGETIEQQRKVLIVKRRVVRLGRSEP